MRTSSRPSGYHDRPSRRVPAAPAWAPGKYKQHYQTLPRPFGLSGDAGSPSSEFSVTASRLMQNVMGDDDIEYFASISDDPPYDVERSYAHSSVPITAHSLSRSVSLFPDVTDDWRESDDADGIDEARKTVRAALCDAPSRRLADLCDVPEASGAGGVSGYTGPLGYAPRVPGRSKRSRPRWVSTASSFARAKKAKIRMRTR